ncbi:MAG: hypothetical protein C0473_01145 [Cyanobacteria bacterium DS3.002]|nr:hypothetical protein [Cyanobacteria bacterium DS3.002]
MLRHGKGYQLPSEGVDTRIVQAYMRHENIQHTLLYTSSFQSGSRASDGCYPRGQKVIALTEKNHAVFCVPPNISVRRSTILGHIFVLSLSGCISLASSGFMTGTRVTIGVALDSCSA